MQVLDSIKYTSPNRRSKNCVIEKLVELTGEEQNGLTEHHSTYSDNLGSLLRQLDIEADYQSADVQVSEDNALELFARLYAVTALAIQCSAGHRVSFWTFVRNPDNNRISVVFEYEQSQVGLRADTLALTLLDSVISMLDCKSCELDGSAAPTELLKEFRLFAGPLILPHDTQSIIDVASSLDIPWAKLDREPFQSSDSEWRIRRNGLLKLGHAAHHCTLDGTFCVDRGQHLWPLIKDREHLFQTLIRLDVPVPEQNRDFRNCVSARRAVRLAESIGYPVVVKPAMRSRGEGITLDIPDAESCGVAVEKAQQSGRKVIVEKYIPGRSYKIIVVNGEVIGAVSDKSGNDVSSEMHPPTLRLALDLAGSISAGILVVDLVTGDPGQPLDQGGGAVVDLDVAPELDQLLPVGCEIHNRAITALVHWLYPQGSTARIPLVGVTGTNGKTTTCRMIAHVSQASGLHPGLACTDGIYIDGNQVEAGDRAGITGHHEVLESRHVNLGILETARGGLAHSGMVFDWCNVAVCLNVTEDHLGEYGLDTLEQMAELKRSVLEAARDAAVLNADNEYCLSMLPYLRARHICLVSTKSGVEDLARLSGPSTDFAVVETVRKEDWMVLYQGGERIPIIEVAGIPATFDGLATTNVCNALHAIAACHYLAVDLRSIREGIRNFTMSFQHTPGRLNFYDEHPFRVIMDFAHNAAGLAELAAFVDRLEVSGRRLLMFQVRGDYTDRFVTDMASVAAGHFDHYVCRTHPVYTGPDPQKVLDLMQGALLSSGVSRHQVTATTDPDFAVQHLLEMGEVGDLLVFAPGSGQREDTWNRITSFQSE